MNSNANETDRLRATGTVIRDRSECNVVVTPPCESFAVYEGQLYAIDNRVEHESGGAWVFLVPPSLSEEEK